MMSVFSNLKGLFSYLLETPVVYISLLYICLVILHGYGVIYIFLAGVLIVLFLLARHVLLLLTLVISIFALVYLDVQSDILEYKEELAREITDADDLTQHRWKVVTPIERKMEKVRVMFVNKEGLGLLVEDSLHIRGYPYLATCVIKGEMQPVGDKYVAHEGDFDYAEYLSRNDIQLQMEYPQSVVCEEVVEFEGLDRAKYIASQLRNYINSVFAMGLSEPKLSLAIGILTGEDREFPDVFKDQLKVTGTTHIIAASGYNLGLIVRAVNKGLGKILPYTFRLLLLLLLIWFFVLVSGAAPSLVRAAIFWSLMLAVRWLGLPVRVGDLLVIAVALYLVYDPQIVFDIGLQLSVASMVGLVFLLPVIEAAVKDIAPKAISVFEEFEVLPTFVSTVLTIPILLLHFGQISMLGLFTNIMLAPVLAYATLVGLGVGVCTALSLDFFASLLFRVLDAQMAYFVWVVEWASQFEMLVIDFEISSSLFVVFYIFLFILIVSFYPREVVDSYKSYYDV